MEKSVEVDRYSAVLDLNGDYIFYTAQDMCEQRRNTLRKPQAMPVEEDVSKLMAFYFEWDTKAVRWWADEMGPPWFCKDAELDC